MLFRSFILLLALVGVTFFLIRDALRRGDGQAIDDWLAVVACFAAWCGLEMNRKKEHIIYMFMFVVLFLASLIPTR